jgi:hypothetical protein
VNEENVRRLYIDADAQEEPSFYLRYRMAGVLFLLTALTGLMDFQLRGIALGGTWLVPVESNRILIGTIGFALVGVMLLAGIRRSPAIGLIWLLVYYAMTVFAGGVASMGAFFSIGLLALMLAPWATSFPAWIGGILYSLLVLFQAGTMAFILLVISRITAPGSALVADRWVEPTTGQSIEMPEQWVVVRPDFAGLQENSDSIFATVIGMNEPWAPSWLQYSDAVLVPRPWIQAALQGDQLDLDESTLEGAWDTGLGLISIHPLEEETPWLEQVSSLAKEAVTTMAMIPDEMDSPESVQAADSVEPDSGGEGAGTSQGGESEESDPAPAPEAVEETLDPELVYSIEEEGGLTCAVFWTRFHPEDVPEEDYKVGVWDAMIRRPSGILRIRLVGEHVMALLGHQLLELLLDELGIEPPQDLEKVIPEEPVQEDVPEPAAEGDAAVAWRENAASVA